MHIMTTKKATTASMLKGIDISHYNGQVDFAKIKAAGCEFVFIKATEGTDLVDARFNANWHGAKAAGIVRGAYHFFQPGVSVTKQADNFLKVVGQLEPGDLFPVIDAENPRLWKGITPRHAADLVITWLELVEKHLGVPGIIYAGDSFVRDILGADARLAQSGRKLYLARYRKTVPPAPKPFSDWAFWQFSQTGSWPGIKGAVDLDLFKGSRSDLLALTKQAAAAKAAIPASN
jgi:lysozyme